MAGPSRRQMRGRSSGRPGRPARTSITCSRATPRISRCSIFWTRQEGSTVEALSPTCQGEAVEEAATELIFDRVPVGAKARHRRGKPKVKVLYFRRLLEAKENDGKVMVPETGQPVQLAMFAL
jgi:hypothetical protein